MIKYYGGVEWEEGWLMGGEGGGHARENRGRRAGKAVNREFNEGGSRERKAKW